MLLEACVFDAAEALDARPGRVDAATQPTAIMRAVAPIAALLRNREAR
jgi:hypothetical protein